MGAQARLPATLPSAPLARKAHREAVNRVRDAEIMIANLRNNLRDARAELKKAEAARRAAEDDLEAIDQGTRPERT